MIVPKFWAEARLREKIGQRQVTIRRFGWSNVSQADAQASADARAREALDNHLRGETVARRDLKRAYNGSEGVPIREEIVHELGPTVITRNSYGALCLNTPNVLFVDIDFAFQPGCWIVSILTIAGALVGLGSQLHIWGMVVLGIGGMIFGYIAAYWLSWWFLQLRGGNERLAMSKIERFIQDHPHWHVRVYRTPAGLRVLALHSVFDPTSAEVEECFRALDTDPIYVRMCQRQHCFRARVSPKPWRIGIGRHLKPTAVWPIDPAKMPERTAWVRDYEQASRNHASCQFVTSLGSAQVHPDALEVQRLHDEFCQATTNLPIA